MVAVPFEVKLRGTLLHEALRRAGETKAVKLPVLHQAAWPRPLGLSRLWPQRASISAGLASSSLVTVS